MRWLKFELKGGGGGGRGAIRPWGSIYFSADHFVSENMLETKLVKSLILNH